MQRWGWPATRRIKDPQNPGKKGFEIKANYLHPRMVRPRRLILLALILMLLFDGADMQKWVEVDGVYPFIFAGIAVLGVVSYGFFNWLVSQRLWMRLFEDRIEVAGWTGFENYSTRLDHAYMFQEHDKSQAENLQFQQNPNIPRFYSNAQYITLYHNHQLIPLACVYPMKKAQFGLALKL